MTQDTTRPPKPRATPARAGARKPAATPAAATAPRPRAARKTPAGAGAPPARRTAAAVARPAAPRKPAAGKPAPGKSARAPKRPALVDVVLTALEDLKAQNVTVLDVRNLTSVTDTIVIASGTSDRHVKSLAGNVVASAAEAGYRPLGREGERDGEWVLVDLADVIVHVMLPRVREFYGLEKLWDVRSGERAADG